MLSIRDQVTETASVVQSREAAHRAFGKISKWRYTQALIRTMEDTSVYSASGIYLGQTSTYNVDLTDFALLLIGQHEGFITMSLGLDYLILI